MIFETIKEISTIEILLTLIPMILIIITLIHMWFSLNRKNKIHRSYHKGYNQAKSDKVQYYSTLKILTDDFKEIILNLEKDNIKPSIITTNLLIEFKQSLKDYYNN